MNILLKPPNLSEGTDKTLWKHSHGDREGALGILERPAKHCPRNEPPAPAAPRPRRQAQTQECARRPWTEGPGAREHGPPRPHLAPVPARRSGAEGPRPRPGPARLPHTPAVDLCCLEFILMVKRFAFPPDAVQGR